MLACPRNHRQLTPRLTRAGEFFFVLGGLAECQNPGQVTVEAGFQAGAVVRWNEFDPVDESLFIMARSALKHRHFVRLTSGRPNKGPWVYYNKPCLSG